MTRCDECKFYVKDVYGIDYGRCHRYPPKVYRDYTLVDADDWCGEWQEKSDVRT